ncbi:MAG: hypothetical protein OXR72_18380 [Gemmatimonadota bacterium]|nr:hypothetical protein [Gemmatimonadota bacterium]
MSTSKQAEWDRLNDSLWRIINRQDMKDRETRFKAAMLLYELHFKSQDEENSMNQEVFAHVLATQLAFNLLCQHMDVRDGQELKEKVQALIAFYEDHESNEEGISTDHYRLIARFLRKSFAAILHDQTKKKPPGFHT